MTPAKLQELAREAGLTIDGDSVRSPHLDCVALEDLARFAEWVQADTLLSADFYKLVRASALEEAATALERETLQKRRLYAVMNAVDLPPCATAAVVRALAQQAGGEQASRGTIPADRRHDAGG